MRGISHRTKVLFFKRKGKGRNERGRAAEKEDPVRWGERLKALGPIRREFLKETREGTGREGMKSRRIPTLY